MLSHIFYFFLIILLCPYKIAASPSVNCQKKEYTDLIATVQVAQRVRCNGVIVTKNYVVTTALCVTDYLNRLDNGECDCRANITIIYNLLESNLFGLHCAKRIGVEKTFIHKWFVRHKNWAVYDVAMLKTRGNMELKPSFKYPEFPTERNKNLMIDICEKHGVMAGYWMNKLEKEPKANLICLDVTVANYSDCRKAAGANMDLKKPSLMCTHDKSLASLGVCKGYHGAPFFCQDKAGGKIMLHGLASHRHGLLQSDCSKGGPMFYTRTDDVLNFLKDPVSWSG